MSTSANTTDWQKNIDDQYGAQLAAQKKKLEAGYGQGRQNYGKQMADAGDQYQGLRNQAHTGNAMAEQARKENMANMGMSGAGGTSQSLQQRNQTALLNTVGDVNRQQQDYTDNIKLALGNLTTQYNADVYSAEQQNAADKMAAQTAYGQWQSQFDLSQQQFDLTKKNSEFDQAWALLQKGRISKDQFEKRTGIKLRR